MKMMDFWPSWGGQIRVQQTFMDILDEKAYKEFQAKEAECLSQNLQSSLDMMKEATPKELTKLMKFNTNAVKEAKKVGYLDIWSTPITWKADYNFKETKCTTD